MTEPLRCFVLHPADNVATMLVDAPAGAAVAVAGQGGRHEVRLGEPVALGHKVALSAIGADRPVMKFGVPIGRATRDIAAGEWVHLHNCASFLDERSGTLDLQTGAATDTRYA